MWIDKFCKKVQKVWIVFHIFKKFRVCLNDKIGSCCSEKIYTNFQCENPAYPQSGKIQLFCSIKKKKKLFAKVWYNLLKSYSRDNSTIVLGQRIHTLLVILDAEDSHILKFSRERGGGVAPNEIWNGAYDFTYPISSFTCRCKQTLYIKLKVLFSTKQIHV